MKQSYRISFLLSTLFHISLFLAFDLYLAPIFSNNINLKKIDKNPSKIMISIVERKKDKKIEPQSKKEDLFNNLPQEIILNDTLSKKEHIVKTPNNAKFLSETNSYIKNENLDIKSFHKKEELNRKDIDKDIKKNTEKINKEGIQLVKENKKSKNIGSNNFDNETPYEDKENNLTSIKNKYYKNFTNIKNDLDIHFENRVTPIINNFPLENGEYSVNLILTFKDGEIENIILDNTNHNIINNALEASFDKLTITSNIPNNKFIFQWSLKYIHN